MLTINEMFVYVPCRNFELSKRFYTDMGFALTPAWGGMVDCRLGNAVFRLQDYYVEEWAGNFMIRFDVDDVIGWFEHARRMIDGGDYGSSRYIAPEIKPDATLCYIVDPSGVLLVFVQKPDERA